MTKKQHYMTKDERQQLEALRRNRIPVAEIARQLGFCRQTIYDELKRGEYVHTCSYWDEVRYSAAKAQQIPDRNQTAKGRPLKIGNDHAYANFLEKKMLVDLLRPVGDARQGRVGYPLYRLVALFLFLPLLPQVFVGQMQEYPFCDVAV